MSDQANTWRLPKKVLRIIVTRGEMKAAGRTDTEARRKKITTPGLVPGTAIMMNTKDPRSIGTEAAGATRSRAVPSMTGQITSAPSTKTGTKITGHQSIMRSTESPEDPESTTIYNDSKM